MEEFQWGCGTIRIVVEWHLLTFPDDAGGAVLVGSLSIPSNTFDSRFTSNNTFGGFLTRVSSLAVPKVCIEFWFLEREYSVSGGVLVGGNVSAIQEG